MRGASAPAPADGVLGNRQVGVDQKKQKGNKMSDAEKIALLLGTLKSCKLEFTMIEPFLASPYQKGVTAAKEACGKVIDEVEVSA